MILNFIFNHLNVIVLVIWIAFLAIVAIRYFRPAWVNLHTNFLSKISVWVKNISYRKLILIAIGLNIFYGLFVSWGQYYVWGHGSELTKALLNSPLPKQTPFLEWARPFFENNLGYFLFYVWGRFWLYIFISFLLSGILYLIFRTWNLYRGGFGEQGPELLLVLMLIAGYPGILVLIPLGFIFAILLFIIFHSKRIAKRVYSSPQLEQAEMIILKIEPAFILATLFALLFTRIILNMI